MRHVRARAPSVTGGAALVLAAALTLILGCRAEEQPPTVSPSPGGDTYAAMRRRMVSTQIRKRGVEDARVLEAMAAVPRHEFVPEEQRPHAYDDRPLPIGHEQTISQPYIVALMTQMIELREGDRVLEIGTGSGYQAAVLAEITPHVYTIEIIPELAERAEETLRRLGYDEVNVKCGDGYLGWPDHAPFDAIIVTCAPDAVPEALKEQLAEGGRMVIPVGPQWTSQTLYVFTKERGKLDREATIPVRFVPMVHGSR